jgi:drug/metabolite transporter (DMT)-like permease
VWTSIIYLGAFGTVIGFVWYYEGVKAIGPSRTAVFNNLVPAFGIVLAAVLLGEPILISMVAGGVLAVIGVTLTNR